MTLGTALAVEAQDPPPPDEELEEGNPDPAAKTAASSTAPVETPAVVKIETGAPQPPSQNQASPLPPQPGPATPTVPVVKIGGGMILLYANNYAPEFDVATGAMFKKHTMDVWRASIVLDAKFDRFGIHYEFRARDRGLRWLPVNSWIEELYASFDIIEPGSSGPLTLKVGKEYDMFGRFWDNSFYGNIHLRDGLKLVPNWGLSLEGTLGAGKTFGLKYYAQYFVMDGQTSTANTNRDTNSIVVPGTTNTLVGGRKREDITFRLEPSWTLSPLINVKLGVSFKHFTADFPDTRSAEAVMNGVRHMDQDNTSSVTRYGADIAAQVLWFGFWGEYVKQNGAHTNAWPFAPVAAVPAGMNAMGMMTPAVAAQPGRASDDVTYWLGGLNFTIDRYTIQYNYNMATYKNIEVIRNGMSAGKIGTHKEWIHNPGVSAKINDQLRIILEAPFWFRTPVEGLTVNDATKPAAWTGETEAVEQQVIATLHGKF